MPSSSAKIVKMGCFPSMTGNPLEPQLVIGGHLTLPVASRKYGAQPGSPSMARITSLAEAIKSVIRDGDTIALEGFTHLIPHAAGHEIIRQGRKNLTLVRMTPDIVYDQLIGMGCARKLVFSWGGNPGVGSLHRFRDAVRSEERRVGKECGSGRGQE